ncbi:MFS transporter [Nonomuraea sp. NPDC059194]|uniref:MFS transporter n=1 Tax=Nonomuraea sp. NPDC059194 TaxID=3346764 RepID=UPI0036A3E34A
MSPGEPALRLGRAAVFAVVCVLVTAGGHLFAGGAAVPAEALFAGGVGALGLAYGLNGRERGRAAVLGLTITAQAALHALFTWAAPGSDVDTGHGHLNVGMLAVHLTAAWLTGWWLHRGESAFWLLVRLWGAAPLAVLRWLLTARNDFLSPVRHAVPAEAPAPCSPWELVACFHLRGPPARPHAG